MLYRTIFIASSRHRTVDFFHMCCFQENCIRCKSNINKGILDLILSPKRSFTLLLVVKLSKWYQRFICRLSQYKPAKKAF